MFRSNGEKINIQTLDETSRPMTPPQETSPPAKYEKVKKEKRGWKDYYVCPECSSLPFSLVHTDSSYSMVQGTWTTTPSGHISFVYTVLSHQSWYCLLYSLVYGLQECFGSSNILSACPLRVEEYVSQGLYLSRSVCLQRWLVHFDSILLTVLGFVVGLSLSFRSSTAYERWTEGRKYWVWHEAVNQGS